MKTNKYKFLSRSVLLEETGLPKMNYFIIISITVIIGLFIFWSNIMIVYEKISVTGWISPDQALNTNVYLKIPTKSIVDVTVSNEVFITIPGITTKDFIKGNIISIEPELLIDEQGNNFYKANVILNLTDRQVEQLNYGLLNQMEVNGEVVVGSRSLLSIILGPVWDIGKDVVNN